MTKERGKNWREESRAVPGSGKVGFLGRLRGKSSSPPPELTNDYDPEEEMGDLIESVRLEEANEKASRGSRMDRTTRERMRKYVERKGKK